MAEANYIGSGNSGRNTTIIRANYGIAESVRFYQHSLELYATLEEEECWIMHSTKGLLWLAHTEWGSARAAPRPLEPGVRRRDGDGHPGGEKSSVRSSTCPAAADTPVLGASYPGAATARHDRVVWAYARGALRRGRTSPAHPGHRSAPRRRPGDQGPDRCRADLGRVVLLAVGGRVTLAAMADVRLPIRTHPPRRW